MPAVIPSRQEQAGAHSSVPKSHFPSPLSERELSRLWRDQTFPPEALVTRTGERVRVIYRGRPGAGAGPDFRDALIAAPGGLLRGDVELHVRSSDFHRHGHDRDPAYAGVVLHVVFRNDEGTPTSLPGGGAAAVLALGDWAQGRAAEIERWLQRPALWQEPCFSSPSRLGAVEVKATLERLGEMRFRQKAAVFARRLGEAGRDQVLWEALLEALAFGSAPGDFRLLAQRLSWPELRGRLLLIPLPDRGAEAWRLLGGVAGTVAHFGRGRGRPAGRPERRLQGAAQLAARFTGTGLVQTFVEASEQANASIEGDQAKGERPRIESGTNHDPAVFSVSSVEFRAGERGRSESRTIRSLTALLTVPGIIGRSRAVEIIGNAVLPCLAALGPEARTRLAESLYRRLPLPARYGAVRHLHEAVGGALPVDFRRQQGMLYLLKQYCTQGGCGHCPLS